MAITYDAPSNTITIVGGPYTWTDVYNADVAGGWGVVTLQGTLQFMVAAKVVVGDTATATVFGDTGKQVYFTLGAVVYISLRKKSTTTFGALNDAADKTTNNGCHFIFASSGWAYPFQVYAGDATVALYLYSCILEFPNVASGGTAPYIEDNSNLAILAVYNCILDRVAIKGFPSTADIYNVQITNGYYGLNSIACAANICYVSGCKYAFYGYQNVGDIVSNVTARNCITKFFLQDGGSGSRHLVNFDVDSWTFTWNNNPTGTIYRQYTFDLKVTDVAGTAIGSATVTLKDVFDTTVFSVSTAADGTITQQTVSRGYYNKANGDTLQEYSPHMLTITKTGYQTYTEIFTLSTAINWAVALLPTAAPTVLTGDANPPDVLTGKTFYNDDATNKLTGTLRLPFTRTRIRTQPSELEEPLLMLTGVLLTEKLKSKGSTTQLPPLTTE